jgi:hypothetical protein
MRSIAKRLRSPFPDGARRGEKEPQRDERKIEKRDTRGESAARRGAKKTPQALVALSLALLERSGAPRGARRGPARIADAIGLRFSARRFPSGERPWYSPDGISVAGTPALKQRPSFARRSELREGGSGSANKMSALKQRPSFARRSELREGGSGSANNKRSVSQCRGCRATLENSAPAAATPSPVSFPRLRQKRLETEAEERRCVSWLSQQDF